MNLYQVNKEIDDLLEIEGEVVNQDTGEVYTEQQLVELKQAFLAQTESFGLWLKNKGYFVEAMKAEKKALDERIKREELKLERATNFATELLIQKYDGKFLSPKIQMGLRKSESLEIINESLIPKKFFKKEVTYKPIKADIKAALKLGIKINGVVVIENKNLQIK